MSADRDDIFDTIREELRLSREQRERSEGRYAESQAASDARHAKLQEDSKAFFERLRAESDARHAELQREVLESNRMVMQRMDGLVKENRTVLREVSDAVRENSAVIRENSAAIRENAAAQRGLRETIGDLRDLARAQTGALLKVLDRLPPNEAAA